MDWVLSILWNVIAWAGQPLFYLALGLLVGWNVLPQPGWVKKLWDKAKVKIKG